MEELDVVIMIHGWFLSLWQNKVAEKDEVSSKMERLGPRKLKLREELMQTPGDLTRGSRRNLAAQLETLSFPFWWETGRDLHPAISGLFGSVPLMWLPSCRETAQAAGLTVQSCCGEVWRSRWGDGLSVIILQTDPVSINIRKESWVLITPLCTI